MELKHECKVQYAAVASFYTFFLEFSYIFEIDLISFTIFNNLFRSIQIEIMRKSYQTLLFLIVNINRPFLILCINELSPTILQKQNNKRCS